ncbi:hypothetical protein L1887_12716 [Cichorium endivia]|nr:hypothetical protein L1887_12716 [Cichorium endivia]
MREQLWSICLKAFRSRLRSKRVVDHSSVETIHDSEQSCWANMLPELLTNILMRIEASESDWPSRKNVVSCAGVCRSWRKNMNVIVKWPQLSGNLTFPVSLKQTSFAAVKNFQLVACLDDESGVKEHETLFSSLINLREHFSP